MSICNLGVMATEYVRDSPVLTSISVGHTETEVIVIENIYSKHHIGNTLSIKLRQKAGSELPWVSFVQGSPS